MDGSPVRPLCVILFLCVASLSLFIVSFVCKDSPVSDTTILLCKCDIIVIVCFIMCMMNIF